MNWSITFTKIISAKTAKQLLPTIATNKLKGGIIYKDGQFDDARLAINLAQTAAENGGTVLNYCKVINLTKDKKKVTGIIFNDTINKKAYTAKGTVVINATGVFTNTILKMDNAAKSELISPSQGIHIVLDKKFFPGNDALMIPETADGRVLFAVPWHGKVVVGTTDTPVEKISLEPKALEEEVQFIIRHINLYLNTGITKNEVKSIYVGLRPLVKNNAAKKTSLLPRDHTIIIMKSGLVTITGGKWTTYRKMAKDVIDKAIASGKLKKENCVTENLQIHGWTNNINTNNALNFYGADAVELEKLCEEDETLKELLHPTLTYIKASVIWAVRNEMAMTVEDVLARRTRMLFLDAQAAIDAAPTVAKLMAKEINRDEGWIAQQLNSFTTLANGYLSTNPL